ncbi:MAG: LCP family protein [Acidimicrobiales bacterium]
MATPTVAPAPPVPDDQPGARRRSRHRYRRRRWPRRVLIGLNIFLALCVLGAASLYGYVKWRFGEINRVTIGSLFHPSRRVGGPAGSISSAGPPINILIVGDDTRAFVQAGSADAQAFGGAGSSAGASDTMMLVHLDPAARTASLLSIPRDLWVPIAGKGYSQRINTAIQSSPDVLVRTIQDDLGIPINHFVEVNFQTFRDVVNAIGGVKFWYPEPVRDTYSGLNITTPGCYNLNGDMALALVRARHMEYFDHGYWNFEGESDLARIRRQQLFVKKVVRKAQGAGLLNFSAINGIVGGVVNNLTVDSGFSQTEMLKLAKIYRNFNPDTTPTATLPTVGANIGGASVLLLIKSQAPAVINAWEGIATGQQGPTATSPSAPAVTVPPADVNVSVLNGSGRTGEATLATTQLRTLGFNASIGGNGRADSFTYASPVLRYGPGGLSAAQEVQRDVGGGALLQPDPSLTGTSLIFITGATFTGVSAGASGAGSTVTTSSPVSALTPISGGPTPSSQAQPPFPGTHGTDPPPAGSGC